MADRCTKSVQIVNRLGLHARPAMAFVDLAATFGCDVTLTKGSETVDGKSIMEIRMLAATKGTSLELCCVGPNADKAVDALAALVARGFDEE